MSANNPRHSRFFWRSSAIFGILDQAYRFKEVNTAWENTLGLSTSQLLAKRFTDFVHADDQASTKYYLDQLNEGMRSISFSNQFRHYDNSYRSMLWEINGAASADYAYYVVGMDITSREQPMIADEMISVLQEGVVLQYANGTIGACNPSAEHILGLPADQMMGWVLIDPDWRLIHEDDSPFPTETHPAICTLRTGQSYANVVMGIVKSDESVIWIRINSYPLWRNDVTTPYAVVISFSDITNYKETEQSLRKRSVSPQGGNIVNNNYDLWEWNLETNEMRFSPQWESLLGFDERELLPHIDSWHKRIHPADYSRVKSDIKNHLENVTPVYENTHRLQHKDGSYHWVLSRGTVIKDTNGEPVRMMGTHIDVTESRYLEEELSEIGHKYQQLQELETDAIFILDAKVLDIIEANKTAVQLYGYSHEQLLKTNILTLSAQPDKTEKAMKKVIKTTSTQYHKKQSGDVFPVEVITSSFLSKGRTALMLIARDISERQKVETALWESESKYRQLFEASSIPTIVFDANTQQIFDVNQAATDLYGYTKPEWVNKKTEEVSAELGKQRGSLSSQKRVIPLRWHKKRDGTVFPVEISTGNTYLFQGRSLVCATLRDITERKAHEEVLRQERDFVNNLVQASPMFFVAINPDDKIRMMNRAMLQATQYTLEDIINNDFLITFVPKVEQPLISSEIQKLITSMQPSLMECHILTKNGKSLLIEWHSRAVVKADGVLDYFFAVGIDVTEHKQAQGLLRLFKSIVDVSYEAIEVRNVEKQLVYINQAHEKLFGRNFKTAQQFDLESYYSPESLNILQKKALPTIKNGNSWNGELETFCNDGSKLLTRQYIDAVRDNNRGNILFSFGLIQNVENHEHKLKKLYGKWEESQMLFNNIPAMIWYRDKDNKLLRYNRKAEEIFKNFTEQLDEYTDCKEVISLGRSQFGIVHSIEETSAQSSTSSRWLQFDKITCLDEQDNITGAIIFAIDITKHKQIQSLLASKQTDTSYENENLLFSVFDAAKMGVCLTDDRSKFIQVNQAYAGLYGYTKDELVGQVFTSILPQPKHVDAIREYYDILMATENTSFVKKRKSETHRDGHSFEADIMVKRVVLEDNRKILLTVVSKVEE
ncbi:PAS domain S-box protein [Candidatus Halobeggiatoa sp. HSG11]|nr:PAS domain S-box protein [Candidatus Halobeggiatoa sp. HSG11]